MISKATVLASILALSSTATAASLEGVSLPDKLTVADKTLVLNGLGMREATMFKVDVYVAGLYLEAKSKDPKTIIGSRGAKKLALHFVREVGRKDIEKAWSEGFEKNSKKSLAALKPRIARLNSWMSDMKKGDKMAFTELPGKGIEVSVRGKVKGVIEGDDFAAGVWAIYLGPKPPNPELKRGLLGK